MYALHYRFDLDLEEQLQLNGGGTVHTKHLQILLTEVFKCLTKLNPEFMWNCFEAKDTAYNLRSQSIGHGLDLENCQFWLKKGRKPHMDF